METPACNCTLPANVPEGGKRFLITKICLVFTILLIWIATTSRAADLPGKDLPKVLIIGDSISLGYTPFVAETLNDVAIVEHNTRNAQHTQFGLRLLDRWLGETRWSVIHFNWGLWDLCYRNPESKEHGQRDKIGGTITTPIEQYEKNLEALVLRLKKTGAKLIWANTTVVPEGEPGRNAGDEEKYNAVAAKIMEKHGVAINDLHTLTKNLAPELHSGKHDVHYKEDGYRKIAEQVAAAIRTALQ